MGEQKCNKETDPVDETEKSKLICKEKRRLNKNFKEIESKKKSVVEGLMERAAFMRVSLDELEADLNEHGFTEPFSQGDQEPYQRKRPQADVYNQMNNSYQKIIKQLTDLLPKEEPKRKEGDGFDSFIEGREDL